MTLKSSDLRDSSAQKKYREQSKALNKSAKHVAHYFSLDIAAQFNQFVSPPVPVETLKILCNQRQNFRMVDAKINLSNHKRIDNHLLKSFKEIILRQFNENERYKQLLKTNPTKLELESGKHISCVTLKGTEASRASAQTKRIQQLNLPNHYTAFARLVYRCFRDSKNRYIWNDVRNTMSFRQYLSKQRRKSNQAALVNPTSTDKGDEKCFVSDDTVQQTNGTLKKPSYTDTADVKCSVSNDVIQKRKTIGRASDNPMIGTDGKGRTLYKGTRGGIYYQSPSGRKVYITSVARYMAAYDRKLPHITRTAGTGDVVYGTDSKHRTLYKGKKGGIYYKTASGNKAYVRK